MKLMTKILAVLATMIAVVALSTSSASAAYSNYSLTVNSVTNPNTAALSSSTAYTVTATGLVANHSYYLSTCADPGTSGLSSPPACAFAAGSPYTLTLTSSASGTLSTSIWKPSKTFVDVHGSGTVTCKGATPVTGEVQCAVVVVDAVDHTLAANYDRVKITVN